ncbi:glycosyltransferase family 2 protein [Candidatus Parcubacteria bacterium]|nr:MAG: glycosyltransferase family 2 protein [Candidatus Parcubacteria bacterium]
MEVDYLKIGKASDLRDQERIIYRCLEILPGFLSWTTLLGLIILSYFYPVFVAFFIIAFDVYWLLLVAYLGIHLIVAYRKMKKNISRDWRQACEDLKRFLEKREVDPNIGPLKYIYSWKDIIHLIILPTYNEGLEIVRTTVEAIAKCGYPTKNMIVVLATEGRAGEAAQKRAQKIEQEFGDYFRHFLVTVHPDNIEGEIKGKGSNQTWAARQVKEKIIDAQGYDYNKILVSVFDIDTVVEEGFFYCLTHKFLSVKYPYRASFQPIPIYNNNIWQAPFFSRIAASSNTFWQMMQQIRQEKLATYSSHSMTWRALVDIGFWSTKMVSEDSRIFWHCLLYYYGDYRVEPLYFPVSMDICMDRGWWQTAKNLYKQQRRWGWGVENVPYLIFNIYKRWDRLPKRQMVNKILVQLYGFHSWATNALIIAVVGWMPLLLGGERFNSTVLSGNLPFITRTLMTLAMSGLVLSAIVATVLLPANPRQNFVRRFIIMPLQWLILPLSIIVFGAIPSLEAQTRLMLGKYLGFWVTPKNR